MNVKNFSEWQMKQYFSSGSEMLTTLALAGLGLAALVVGVLSQGSIILLVMGVVLLAAGGIGSTVIRRSKPTDREYDEWVEKQASMIEESALSRLHLDRTEVIKVLRLRGFVPPGSEDASKYSDVRVKKGADGYLRCSVTVYTFFVCAGHRLSVYTCDVDALNQSCHIEQKDHYFYKDIVGITTRDVQDKMKINGKEHTVLLERFTLRIADGGGVNVGATLSAKPIGKSKKDTPTLETIDSQVNNTTAALLMLLRDMKGSDTEKRNA